MKHHQLNNRNFDLILDEIESIEFIGEYETIDICVDEVHMFFANDIYVHNSGSNKSLLDADTIAGGYSKGAVADFWMSIGRNNRDKLSNAALFNIIKNRFGPDGMHLPAIFDTSKSHIEIFNERSETGKKVKEKVLSGEEFEMQYAAQQFQKLANSNRKEPTDLF